MKENLKREDITPELKDMVYEWLVAHATALITREKVDAIATDLLKAMVIHNQRTGERIVDPGHVHMASEEEFGEYLDFIHDAEREDGIKPWDMERELCPALVAEHEQRKVEWAMLDEMAEILEMGYDPGGLNNALLCAADGLKSRQKFIDNIVGAVLAMDEEQLNRRTFK